LSRRRPEEGVPELPVSSLPFGFQLKLVKDTALGSGARTEDADAAGLSISHQLNNTISVLLTIHQETRRVCGDSDPFAELGIIARSICCIWRLSVSQGGGGRRVS